MHNHAVIGGTFDRLHAGHREFIRQAFAHARSVTIAVTTDEFAASKELSAIIEDHKTRVAGVRAFLNAEGLTDRASIVPLADAFGVSVVDRAFDAIVVTPDTEANAHKINTRRAARGMTPLAIIQVQLVTGSDHQVISSRRIRMGQISREGSPYEIGFATGTELALPDEMRRGLQAPFGDVCEGARVIESVIERLDRDRPPLVISVGDIVSRGMMDAGRTPNLSIIDGRSQRNDLGDHPGISVTARYVNKPGSIERNASEAVRDAIAEAIGSGSTNTLMIEGEEDLLALPAILYAPLHSVVIYGLANRGIVYVTVNEDHKEQADAVLKQFARI